MDSKGLAPSDVLPFRRAKERSISISPQHCVSWLLQRGQLASITSNNQRFDTAVHLILLRCWCGGCELLAEGSDKYNRHGTGSCDTYPCSGDAHRQCGGLDAFSLYYHGTCGGFV